MNIATGETFESLDAALQSGVPRSDIAEVTYNDSGVPIVKVSSGPFKGRIYKRVGPGNLVRVA